jgi:hypothetical protein
VTDVARKPVTLEVEDIMEEGPLRQAIDRLQIGAKAPGVYLTDRECAALLRAIPKPREYPQWMWIAAYCQEHEKREARGPEAAIRKATEEFDVSRTTVTDARKRLKDFLKTLYSRD